MKTHKLKSTLVGGLLLIGTSGIALAQTAGDDHEAHHPDAGEQTLPDATPNNVSRGGPEGMSGMMDMITPEMMQMMMRMMGEGGMPGVTDGMPGGSMMGMGGMPMGPMTMHGPQGQMGGHALGPGAIYGIAHGATTEMTPAYVEAYLAHMLERHNNPRLRIGEIAEADDGSIIAEIVTVDGSLVQRLAFNRFPGLFRQID